MVKSCLKDSDRRNRGDVVQLLIYGCIGRITLIVRGGGI